MIPVWYVDSKRSSDEWPIYVLLIFPFYITFLPLNHSILSSTNIHTYFKLLCQSTFPRSFVPKYGEGGLGAKRVDTKVRGRKTNHRREESGSKQLTLVVTLVGQPSHKWSSLWKPSSLISFMTKDPIICKSIDWFPYDGDLRHERVNVL